MSAQALIRSLVEALRKEVPMLVRSAPASGDYLEGVLPRQNLERCCATLTSALGPPIKEFSKAGTFEPAVQRLVDRLGGLRFDQCLFLKHGGDESVIYATLWPWASDATRLTLKVGLGTVTVER